MIRPEQTDAAPEPEDEAPGVPRLRTWRGVYVLVLGLFILVVVLLALFTCIYSG